MTITYEPPPEGSRMNLVTSETCDLIKLMPDSQVNEILDFIRMLREIRRHMRFEGREAQPTPARESNPQGQTSLPAGVVPHSRPATSVAQ